MSSSELAGKAPAIEQGSEQPSEPQRPRNAAFIIMVIALSASLFLTAFELSTVSTALPTIVHSIRDFPAADFVWVGSCYSLASAAFLPMVGSFSQIFGRKPLMLISLLEFSIGSVICGAAPTRSVFLFGRTFQGMGSGGILGMCNTILADIVPLHERGKYNAIFAVMWCVAAAVGPVVGGALSEHGDWRWLFYLNVPVCAVVAAVIAFFLRLKVPKAKFSEKIVRIDWGGNFLIIGTSTAAVIGLTWGGIVYEWSSPRVLAPLIIGFVGMAATLVYEAYIPKEPTIPVFILKSRTSLSGNLQTMIVQCLVIAYVYYLPVYFQACKRASPVQSGVDILGMTLSVAPIAMAGGVTIAKYQVFRPQIWFGWVCIVISTGLLTTLKADSNIWLCIGFCIIGGGGLGIVYAAALFPVLAPLPISANSAAIGLSMFLRVFGQVWGITVGGTVIQNVLKSKLPTSVISQLPASASGDVAYAAITIIKSLPPGLQDEVRNVFADAMKKFWQVMVGVASAGLAVSLAMEDVPLRKYSSDDYGMKEKDAVVGGGANLEPKSSSSSGSLDGEGDGDDDAARDSHARAVV